MLIPTSGRLPPACAALDATPRLPLSGRLGHMIDGLGDRQTLRRSPRRGNLWIILDALEWPATGGVGFAVRLHFRYSIPVCGFLLADRPSRKFLSMGQAQHVCFGEVQVRRCLRRRQHLGRHRLRCPFRDRCFHGGFRLRAGFRRLRHVAILPRDLIVPTHSERAVPVSDQPCFADRDSALIPRVHPGSAYLSHRGGRHSPLPPPWSHPRWEPEAHARKVPRRFRPPFAASIEGAGGD